MLAYVISIFPLVTIIIPIVCYVYTGNILYLYWELGMFLIEIMNHLLKAVFGTRVNAFMRPHGAFNCSIVNIGGLVEGQAGFPSGHMTMTVAFFVIGWLLLGAPWLLVVGVGAALAMGWARLETKCHTLLQVVVGGVTGLLLAVGYYQLMTSL